MTDIMENARKKLQEKYTEEELRELKSKAGKASAEARKKRLEEEQGGESSKTN